VPTPRKREPARRDKATRSGKTTRARSHTSAGVTAVPESPLEQATAEVRSLATQMLSLGTAAARQVGALATGDAGEGSLVTRALGRALALAQTADAVRGLGLAPTAGPLLGRTGKLLRKLREQAGLTLAEVGRAVNLKDPELLAAAERGRAALPFEIVLRLAAVLGRNDPISAAISLTRTSQPLLWETLQTLGFGKLMLQTEREREFLNLLRADDRARRLSDDEFAALLAFVKAAFELAIVFRLPPPAASSSGAKGRGKGRSPAPER
jgi:transcriptional regulator with XRE-family HTH domain